MAHTILVVDDEPAICSVLREVLADEGYRVACACDGIAALAAVERIRPDLVLSDVRMPGLSGVDLADRLRAQGIPVVLMSAHGRRPPRADVPYLAKPFDLDTVVSVVAGQLRAASNAHQPSRTAVQPVAFAGNPPRVSV